MKKILFICHGNICRSPMGEFILKKLVGDDPGFEIASAAVSREEIGNPVYPPARRELARHGISCEGKRARQVTARDYEDYDYLICMDHSNVRNLKRIIGSAPQGKVHLMMDFTDTPGEVSDPWYTGDFAKTYDDIWRGCQGLLARLNDE